MAHSSAGICLEAIKRFKSNSRSEIDRVSRNLNGLSPDDKAALIRSPDVQVQAMREAVDSNFAFVDKLAEIIQTSEAKYESAADDCFGPTAKVVQNLLQTFVREWSEEGLQERSECFEKLLGALEKHLGSQRDSSKASAGAATPRVLCPLTQLGRLAFEVCRRGFQCEACEARPFLFYGSEFARQHFSVKDAHMIQPYVLNTCNRIKAEHHVRQIALPEVAVPSLPSVRFGDFAHLYDSADTLASFDGVLTSFALDASPNVLRFIRTIAHVVRPGGLWANFGPLAYDSEHDEGHGGGMELSWEELRYAISHFFELQEECFVDGFHSSNALSMMQLQYSCIYFSGIRNSTAAEGIGLPKSL